MGLIDNNEIDTSFMKSVFSNSSTGDGGLNMEILQKGRQRNDSLMLSFKNCTSGKFQEMGGGKTKRLYLCYLLTVALKTVCLDILRIAALYILS